MTPDNRMSDDEAEDLVAAAEHYREDGDLEANGFSTTLLAKAAATVLRARRRDARELERERARGHQQQPPRVRGARLIDDQDGGGRRQYLRGEPVHCGAGLWVLTHNGWMAGRYERAGDRATFWFTLPGVAEECVIRIQPDMLFAWPSELTLGRGVDLPNGPRVAGV
jgi:hypothetical protein